MLWIKIKIQYEFEGIKYTDEYIAKDVRAGLKAYRKIHPEYKNVKHLK